MDKMKYIIQILVAITLLGCTDEEIFKSKGDIEVTAGFAKTRTTFVEDDGITHVTWNTGDAIGLFTKEQNNLQYTALNDGDETKFGTLGEKITATEGEKVYAYYPWIGGPENPQKMKLPDIQFQSYNNNRFDFIYASSSVNDRKVSLQFKHLFAFIKITLPVDILSVEGDNRLGFYVSSSENIAFQDLYNEGKVYFDMEKEEIVAEQLSQNLRYHISNGPLEGQQEITCYIAILPQTEDAELIVSKQNGDPLLVKNVPTGGFKAGNVYTLYLNGDEVENMKAREREALVALYKATNGDNWTNNTNWCSDKPVSEWYGISAHNNPTRVMTIDLMNNNLCGAIPDEIGNLPSLISLYLPVNHLTGEIPSSICKLTSLKSLGLDHNDLIGKIPENIGNLGNVTNLGLNGNNLEGNLPESMGKMSNLKFFYASDNRLSGNIPKKVLDHPNWKYWNPEQYIFEQQSGYKLTVNPKDLYASTDYSMDGEVSILQTHTKGNGIKIVIMGDQFVDMDMVSGGFYETKAKETMEHYFSIEPFKSLRELFDVIMIKAVSKNNMMTGETAFSSKVTSNFEIDKDKCMEYAKKAIRRDNLDNVQVIMVQNCYVPIANTFLYQNGFSIANCPFGTGNTDSNNLAHPNSARSLTLHEAGGHGFGYLLDEYLQSGAVSGTPSEEFIISFNQDYINYGYYANMDFISDPEKVRWAHFIKDRRYLYEEIGLFEGAYLYKKGIYRPTNSSIMNSGGNRSNLFNAPSREAIYKRAMKLAYGDSWTYDYEEFVKFDEPGRSEWINANTRSANEEMMKNYKHIPPKIFNYPAVVK